MRCPTGEQRLVSFPEPHLAGIPERHWSPPHGLLTGKVSPTAGLAGRQTTPAGTAR